MTVAESKTGTKVVMLKMLTGDRMAVKPELKYAMVFPRPFPIRKFKREVYSLS